MRYAWLLLLLSACMDDVEFDGFLYPCHGGLCVDEGPRAPKNEDPEPEPDGNSPDAGCSEEDAGDSEVEPEPEPDDEGSEDSDNGDDDSSEESCKRPQGNARGWGKWKGKGPC